MQTAIPIEQQLLKRVRYTQTQTKLNIGQRQQNVANAFRVVRPERVREKSIILIDDVITTGSTVEACAQALFSAGARQVIACSIAHA